jgi:hypothetical protein
MPTADGTNIDTARNDLAFMRALAADRDPLPTLYGAHLFAIGVCFAPALFVTAAAYAGVGGVPAAWAQWTSLPASIVYTPLLIYILIRGSRSGGGGGPSQRAVWYVWSAVAAMTLALTIGFIGAGARLGSGAQVMVMWLPALLALYGGAWTMKAFVRGAPWHGLVAAGCLLTSIVCAWTANPANPATQFMIAGWALLAFFAAPGLAIMLAARRRAR